MTATADTIAGDHSTTAIFATSIGDAPPAVMSITGAAGTGTDGAPAACSTMANFGWWYWP
jgi:hypothetical protein